MVSDLLDNWLYYAGHVWWGKQLDELRAVWLTCHTMPQSKAMPVRNNPHAMSLEIHKRLLGALEAR